MLDTTCIHDTLSRPAAPAPARDRAEALFAAARTLLPALEAGRPAA